MIASSAASLSQYRSEDLGHGVPFPDNDSLIRMQRRDMGVEGRRDPGPSWESKEAKVTSGVGMGTCLTLRNSESTCTSDVSKVGSHVKMRTWVESRVS